MNDADKQLRIWLAIRGNGVRTQVRQAGSRACSKRSAKAAGAGIRYARKQQFQWFMNTSGKAPPIKHKFGIP